MSHARASMNQRCSVARDVVTGQTGWGGPETETDRQTVTAALPCRAWAATERKIEDSKLIELATWAMRVPRDADVLERDVVELSGKSLEVLTVIERRGHRLLSLREVS